MDAASYPAWDNGQIAHFLCRADRRVLSQPHSWLHAGVGALNVPAHVEPTVHFDAAVPTKPLSDLDITWRGFWITVVVTLATEHLPWLTLKVQEAVLFTYHSLAEITTLLPYFFNKS